MLSLYRGELLPGFYDDWVVLERERLQAIFEHKMAQLVERLQNEKRWSDILEWGERWIALGQTPEPAYRALMAAHAALGNMAHYFQDGVRLIEFAPLTDASLVAQTVAKTLDLEGSPRQSLPEVLADHLRSKQMLLVFDNCEHLIAACAQLAESLLSACSNLKILATSREALDIPGEALYRVPSLSLPPISQSSAITTLAQYEAVQLFVDRAATWQPYFLLTNQNAPAVEQICLRLDGIPLAIELAAARIRSLTVEQVAARLDDRLRLLTSGSRTAPPRHQTLRAAIDWSYALLSEEEQTLLNRLAVFAGGWTLEAAEAIGAEEQRGRGAEEKSPLLDLLSRLIDKSLVIVDEQCGAARYRMLETIREYAYQKLLDSELIDRRRAHHLAFYLQFAECAEPELHRADQKLWLDRLEAEHDNLRAALGWALREGASPVEAEEGLRLAVALTLFWKRRNYWKEGRAWITRALTIAQQAPPNQYRAKAFMAALILRLLWAI